MGGGVADVNSWSCSGLMVFRRCWLSITLAFLFSSRSSSSLLSWPLPPPSSLWCRFCTITSYETIKTKKLVLNLVVFHQLCQLGELHRRE